ALSRPARALRRRAGDLGLAPSDDWPRGGRDDAMRLSSIVLLAGIGTASLYTAAHPARVMNLYEGMYPSDPYKRQALQICFERDHNFNRGDAASRDACYRQVLAAEPDAGPARAGAAAHRRAQFHRSLPGRRTGPPAAGRHPL